MNRFEFPVTIPASHPALPGHFPKQAIVPGVLLVDEILEKISELGGGEATGLPYVKFLSALKPDECAKVFLEVSQGQGVFRVVMKRGDKDAIIASGKIAMQRAGDDALD